MTINKQDGQAISVNKEKALKSTRKESNQITHRPADGKQLWVEGKTKEYYNDARNSGEYWKCCSQNYTSVS